MPQEPKKRHSRQRQGKRRHAIRLAISEAIVCKNCQRKVKAHLVCKYCGFYKGKEVIDVDAKKVRREKKKQEEENKA